MNAHSLSIITLSVLAMACGKHPGAYEAAAVKASSNDDPVISEANALWEERGDEANLKQALAKYEEAHASNPGDRHTLVRLTRGWYFYGDGFTDDKDLKLERWAKSIEYGAKCLALNQGFADKIAAGEKEKDAVAEATNDEVPCLYWTSTSLGKWAKAQSLSKTLKFLPTVKAYMSKTEELDPTYYNYGPSRYWGAYYAALPSFAGQDLDKSEQYFAASIDGAPDYLPTRALRAEYLWVLRDNVKGFEEDLNHVINADPNGLPATLAENTIEQGKAKALLTKKSELFSKKALEEASGSADAK
jgi:hypothetical protein